MTDIVPVQQDEKTLDGERVEKYQPLYPGHYWKAKKNVKMHDDDDRIPAGCVLLLQRIKKVADVPHTVQLKGHPLLHSAGSYFEFLVHDFLNKFDPEPRGAEIRAQEMRDIQAKIDEQQRDLLNFQSNPAALLAEIRKHPALPAPDRVERNVEKQLPTVAYDFKAGLPNANFRPSSALADIASSDMELLRRQAENQAIIAKKRAELIKDKTTAIANTVSQLTPFYEEQGAAALAQSHDALEIYYKLKSGLATLGLYTGDDVEVVPVREGVGAPADESIHIMQALLFMDEESLINVEEGGADVRAFPEFVKQLKKDDKLLKRLLPYNRCIVAMRYVKDMKDYGDALLSMVMNEKNSGCFLIIRNGENVNIVLSSLEKLERLFPRQKDFDRPFKKSWHFDGIESERITIEDVKFSEARSEFDELVLHYRRILILLAGLYDRERAVIGEITALTGKIGLAMLSLPMQQAIFTAVSDEERALATGRPTFYAWLEEKNARTQPGSRVLCRWKTLMTAQTCPGAVTEVYGRERSHVEVRYKPVKEYGVAIAYARGAALRVRVAVKGESWRSREVKMREFDAQVDLTKFRSEGRLGYICLDTVTVEEINYYIYSRQDRREYVKYVPLLMEARRELERDAVQESSMRVELLSALTAAKIFDDITATEQAPNLINEVVRQWRASQRGASVPAKTGKEFRDAYRSMLDQLWVLAGKGRDRQKVAEKICLDEGRKPLRLVLTGNSKLYLYATSSKEEQEEILGPHKWICRLTLEERKTQVSVSERKQVLLRKGDPRETVLSEWDEAAQWVEPMMEHTLSYEEVKSIREIGRVALARAERWLAKVKDGAFSVALEAVRADTRARSKRWISHSSIFFPLCVARRTTFEEFYLDYPKSTKRDKRERHSFFVGGLLLSTPDALYARGTAEQKKQVVQWFRDYYSNPKSAIERLDGKPTFVQMELNQLPDLTSDFVNGGEFRNASNKLKGWSKDQQEFLKSVKERHYSSDKEVSAQMVIKFDEDAKKIYALFGE